MPVEVIEYSRIWFEWLMPRDLSRYNVLLRSPLASM